MRIPSGAAMLTLLVLALNARVEAQPPPPSPLEGAGYPPPSLEPRPPSGLGAIIVGYAGLGWAVMNAATLPVCTLDFYQQRDATGLCFGVSGAIAAVGLAVAIPSLVVGYDRRRKYKAWRANQRVNALLSKLRFTPRSDGLVLGYQQHW